MKHKWILFVVLMVLCGSESLAADQETKIKYGTQSQLRSCLDLDDQLRVLRKTLEDHVAENKATMFLIQREAEALVEAQTQLDLTDVQQVEVHNKRTEEHNKAVNSANERGEKLKAEHAAFNSQTLEYNKRCATLVVTVSDRETVMKERKTTAKQ